MEAILLNSWESVLLHALWRWITCYWWHGGELTPGLLDRSYRCLKKTIRSLWPGVTGTFWGEAPVKSSFLTWRRYTCPSLHLFVVLSSSSSAVCSQCWCSKIDRNSATAVFLSNTIFKRHSNSGQGVHLISSSVSHKSIFLCWNDKNKLNILVNNSLF